MKKLLFLTAILLTSSFSFSQPRAIEPDTIRKGFNVFQISQKEPVKQEIEKDVSKDTQQVILSDTIKPQEKEDLAESKEILSPNTKPSSNDDKEGGITPLGEIISFENIFPELAERV